MPQLAKGGKWVFGWVIVSPQGEITIPPEAFAEYGFQPGETVLFLRGSRRSGGVIIGRPEKLAQSKVSLASRVVARGSIQVGGRVMLPQAAGIAPGNRLLAVRGSGLALTVLAYGPIYEEAQKHAELNTFGMVNPAE